MRLEALGSPCVSVSVDRLTRVTVRSLSECRARVSVSVSVDLIEHVQLDLIDVLDASGRGDDDADVGRNWTPARRVIASSNSRARYDGLHPAVGRGPRGAKVVHIGLVVQLALLESSGAACVCVTTSSRRMRPIHEENEFFFLWTF